ncbi:MAG: hypothetical protein FJ276_20435, partial [Planctomycetes bacterium]|nr:hypothetical protein [Planctomycetota bacterium]
MMQRFAETSAANSRGDRFARLRRSSSDSRRIGHAIFALWLTLALGLSPGSRCHGQQDALDAAFAALLTYDWGTPDHVLVPIEVAIVTSRDRADERHALEARLLTVLNGDAPRAAKSYVCRKLRQLGTADSVPSLSPLMRDAELSHMARSALEAIPGEEAAAALRDAATQLGGALQIGVVNSLGRRGDAASVPMLETLLVSPDPALARAAVAALAAIESPAAVQAVLAGRESATPELRPAVADACLTIANRFLRAGQLDQAAAILRPLETSDAEHVRWAALQGLVRAEPSAAHDRLRKALATENARIRLAAGELIRQEADESLVNQLAESLSALPEQGQICLLAALRQSPLPSVRSAALEVAQSPNVGLRAAAIRALTGAGKPADVPVLLKYATDTDKTVRDAAQATLVALPEPAVNQALLDSLQAASAPRQVAIIGVLVARQAPDLPSMLLRLAESPDESVRLESLKALESLARPEHADKLVSILGRTPQGRVREAAERAVWRSCSQIEDPAKSIEPVLIPLRDADSARRAALLPALGRLGGERALEIVTKARDDRDKSVRDAAVRALCN